MIYAFLLPLIAAALPAAALLHAPRYLPAALLGTGLCCGALAVLIVGTLRAVRQQPMGITIINHDGRLRVSYGRSTIILDPGTRLFSKNGHMRLERLQPRTPGRA